MANRIANIKTNRGTIRFELLEQDAPKTTENFIKLAQKGYYDGVSFNDEINRSSDLNKGHYAKGTVAMANAGPNTNGSQFFIMHADYPLPPSYTKFGRVVEGQDVVDAIATTRTFAGDRPAQDVVMEKVTIEESA